MRHIFSSLPLSSLRTWAWALSGLLLLSLLIWFATPLIAFNGQAPFSTTGMRWILIALLLAAVGAFVLWKIRMARHANARLMQGLQGAAAADESAVLRARMAEAMAVLKKLRPGGKRDYLYQLPWYLFVGAPGAGKTTALVQSGLRFPLAEIDGKNSACKHALEGIGGTRHCDWWFTEQAVLLDTAGRYTTHDSDANADRAAWFGFLQLLRQYRRRRPINGVIVAIDVSDLLQDSEEQRQQQALAIRERIAELHERLGLRIPVYVMVTKCDLLAGFTEYFANLGREERAQVLGMTFPLAQAAQPDDALAMFPGEFTLLEKQLQDRLPERLQQERDLSRRALVYAFPQQFAVIGDALGAFLHTAFQASRYHDSVLLRGVYFTSGTQEGNPIDRVIGALAASFGLARKVLPENAGDGRSYFIGTLLREVIFAEANLAGANRKRERQRRWLHHGALAAMALVLLAGIAILVTSHARNRQYIAEVAKRTEDIRKLAAATPADGDVLRALPLLNAVRDIPGGHADRYRDVPLLLRAGLYQGDKLGSGAEYAYRRMLTDTLLPRVLARMEEQLRRGTAGSAELLHETLRVYLMLGDPRHFDAEAVLAWIDFDWSANLKNADAAQRRDLSGHATALLQSVAAGAVTLVPGNAELIAGTRLSLARMPLPERVYQRVRRELARAGLPTFSVASAVGRDVTQLLARRSGEPLTRGVDGAFSVAGYRKYLQQSTLAVSDIASDNWVLDRREAVVDAAGAVQLKAAVTQLYFADYIRQWNGLLNDVAVPPFSSLEQGARIANLLGGVDSPLRRLLQEAARETTLEPATPASAPSQSISEAVRGKLDAARRKLESAIGAEAAAPVPQAEVPRNPVDAHFAPLHRLVAGNPAPLETSLSMLKAAAADMDAMQAALRTGATPPVNTAPGKLKREADDKPAPLGAILQTIDNGAASLALGSERTRLNALWGGNAQFCRQAIAGRYPVLRSAPQDITPDDFGRYFGPGGTMDDFFQKNLLPHVDTSGAQWRWRNASIGIAPAVLAEFQRATQIRDAFFAAGGRQPSLRFTLKPLESEPPAANVLLEIDGQPLVHSGLTSMPATAFQLPSGKGDGQVRLALGAAGTSSPLRTEGPWAWFRMIDKGTQESSGQGERFTVRFEVDGRRIAYTLTAGSVVNPFRRELLERFRCVDKL